MPTRNPEQQQRLDTITVFYSGRAPHAGESVFVHDAETECRRCGGFCVDRSSAEYRSGSEMRMAWKLSLSVAGVIVFGTLTALISPLALWPILIPLTGAGWTFTVFTALNALRRVLGGRNPRTAREWAIALKAASTQLAAILLFVAAPYASGFYELFK